MTDYIVYTEIHEGGVERWYYGTYSKERANEVACELGNDYPVFHCACSVERAKDLGVNNLPW